MVDSDIMSFNHLMSFNLHYHNNVMEKTLKSYNARKVCIFWIGHFYTSNSRNKIDVTDSKDSRKMFVLFIRYDVISSITFVFRQCLKDFQERGVKIIQDQER